jgi:tetratricopeptide (TPR) repeat protein
VFTSYEEVLAWFDAESRVLHAVHAMAAESRHDDYCWTLAWYLTPILRRRGRMREIAALQQKALESALRLRDSVAQAHVHYELGAVSGQLGDFEEGYEHLARALDLSMMLGERLNIALARYGLSVLLDQQGRHAEALEHATASLRLRLSCADPAVVAYSENGVGWLYAHLGQYAEALAHRQRGPQLHRASGSRSGEADTLDSIAYTYSALGDYGQALDIYRNIGDLEGESRSLIQLGDLELAAGQPAAARHSWEQALAALSTIPGADNRYVAARLEQLAARNTQPHSRSWRGWRGLRRSRPS